MTGKIENRSSSPSSSWDRDQALIQKQKSPTTGNKIQFGEVAGGTTAECAAICCCCPCGLMNLLILVVYKIPAGILKKALKIRKKRMKKKRRLGLKNSLSGGTPWMTNNSSDQSQVQNKKKINDSSSMVVGSNNESSSSEEKEEEEDMKLSKEELELEEEMWYRFHGAGFWRSPSQVSQRSM